MKYSQMKRFLMEHKDSMKPPYISTLDGILTAGGELIGYQELEMDLYLHIAACSSLS